MNKKDAANYLGFSEKNLQKLMGDGKISFTYIKGKTGQQADFDQVELDRYKNEVMNLAKYSPNIVNPSHLSKNSISTVVDPTPFIEMTDRFDDFLNALKQHTKQLTAPPIDQLKHKLTLTLEEASQLSGIKTRLLKLAIKKGELPSFKLGRSHHIRTNDLLTWVEEL